MAVAAHGTCIDCGTTLGAGDRFCTTCGGVVRADVPHESICASCGATFVSAQKFCSACGAGRRGRDVRGVTQPIESLNNVADRLLSLANRDATGLIAGGIVFVAAASISWIGWLILAAPGRFIGALFRPGDCGALETGTFEMYACSTKVAALTLAGPVAILLALLLCHRWLTARVVTLANRMPPSTVFLLGPLTAAVLFTLAWAPLHYEVTDDTALVSHKAFPAVVACFSFMVGRHGWRVQRLLGSSFFRRREAIPVVARYAVALLVPLLLSLIATFEDRVSNAAFKEQVIALVALATGFLALTPPDGNILAAVRSQFKRRK